jgi:hypothetical protein
LRLTSGMWRSGGPAPLGGSALPTAAAAFSTLDRGASGVRRPRLVKTHVNDSRLERFRVPMGRTLLILA